ncbi:MAG: TetR/AcrR family transcriptional regulator [Paracoccaceae bacterium]
MADGSGDVRRGRKFDQVVAGARAVFMSRGFEGASVDDIAREAGVSKATLYSYFPDKKLLFLEVATLECQCQAQMVRQSFDRGQAPRAFLTEFGMGMTRMMLSEFGISIFRVCIGEAERFPQVGQTFHATGPMAVRAAMLEYFDAAVARGELSIDDPELAADQFFEMCKADLFPKRLLGMAGPPTDAQIARVVTGAVETFLARHGA